MLSRRNLIVGSGAAVACGGLWPTAGLAASAISLPDEIAGERLATVKAAPARGNLVAMTFDDGPHPTLTPALLDMLKARRIRATFYVIGRNAARYPDILKRMVDEGHTVVKGGSGVYLLDLGVFPAPGALLVLPAGLFVTARRRR